MRFLVAPSSMNNEDLSWEVQFAPRANILPRKGDFITRKQWRWAALAGFVIIAILAALRFRVHPVFDWRVFTATFSRLKWRWLILASILSYATYFGRALRWAVFLRPLRPHPHMGTLVK